MGFFDDLGRYEGNGSPGPGTDGRGLEFAQTEVDQLDIKRLQGAIAAALGGSRGQEDVFGFQIVVDQAARVNVFEADTDLGESFEKDTPVFPGEITVFFSIAAGIRKEAEKGLAEVHGIDVLEGDVGQGALIRIFLRIDEGAESFEVGGFQAGLLEESGVGKNSELADLRNVGMAQAPEDEELLAGSFQDLFCIQ